MFKPVPSKVSFPDLEKAVLRFWRERDIFHRTESEREGAPLFALYEGPPTANGSPGIHHVLARVFKDVIPRYKTMKGYRPLRKGGWDTHGLPVELEVEKELGLSSKQDIERYGVEAFNQRCRESVFRYVKEWEEMTDRIGFWIDMQDAYVTFTNDYIETGWWILRQLWDRDLLYQGMKGAPHCPRCVTSLSSHEVALGYQENTADPSIYVKFPLESAPPPAQKPEVPTFFLAWTTTPWTLPGNTALAVAPDEDYAVVEVEGPVGRERLILAQALVSRAIRQEHHIVDTVRGHDLVGLTYRTPYDAVSAGVAVQEFRQEQVAGAQVAQLQPVGQFSPRVIGADFVSLEDGTGIVHIAPAFGDEDLNAGRDHGLAFVQPVDLQGRVIGRFPGEGKFVKDADEEIMRDLQERGLLYHRDVYRHTYPFCWRCGTPLLYYAKTSWYIMTTAVKERLVSGNQEINWYPEHIKEGRFGEWLRNNVDWAISRERYWGSPIPIWKCQQCDAHHCIGSVAELRERALPEGAELLAPERLDLHRPFVDRVTIRCQACGGSMRRIPEVMDAWFDSGAMPLAQWHLLSRDHLEQIKRSGRFPADYICEAVDQTRGWFYTLHALSTLIDNGPCYRNVICLGLILDEKGEKMSKTRGNVVEPWAVLDQQGADALRWYLFTSAPPGNPRRFSAGLVQESLRRFLLTLWNTYSFFVNYANIDRFNPADVQRYWKDELGSPRLAEVPQNELDRWVLSELNSLVASVTSLMDGYNPTDAARRVEEFVEMLSNWYVRRSRRRFWKSESDQDKEWAYMTLYTCLVTLSRVLAPFIPFVAEEMYRNLVGAVDTSTPESVHLSRFPEPDPSLIDEGLARSTRLAMRLASLGRAARSKASIKVRQPLAQALVKLRFPEEEALLETVAAQILDELNVKDLATVQDEGSLEEFTVKPNHALLGPKYGGQVARIEAALREADAKEVAAQVRAGAPVAVGEFSLEPQEVQVAATDRPGLAVAQEGGYAVAVDTRVSPELADEGLARELVHRLQNMRRDAGLELTDHIVAYYSSDDDHIRRVMELFGGYIRQETLSEELRNASPEDDAHVQRQKVEGMEVTLGVRKVTSA